MLSGILSPGREAALLLLALTATAYLRALRHLPPGQRRLAAATPILLSMFLVPLLYDPETEPLFILLATNFPWLSNLAVLGWVQGRGPLAQGLPFRADLAFLLAPALPALPPSTGKGSRAQVPAHQFNAARLAFKLALLAASAVALECGGTPSGRVAALGRSALQSVTLYLFTSLGYEVAACQSQLLSGMPVMAPFNRPYLSSSLGDFWARRWNIVTGAKFRHMVYEPIAGSAAGPPATMGKQAVHGSMPGGSKRAPALAWRRAAAVCATFAASGVAHELGFWYLTRRLSGGG